MSSLRPRELPFQLLLPGSDIFRVAIGAARYDRNRAIASTKVEFYSGRKLVFAVRRDVTVTSCTSDLSEFTS